MAARLSSASTHKDVGDQQSLASKLSLMSTDETVQEPGSVFLRTQGTFTEAEHLRGQGKQGSEVSENEYA